MSHTVKTVVQLNKNIDALTTAVTRMGGKVLGEGLHRLYSESVQGFGFSLPGWKYPLIVNAEGVLSYDDYNGSWGDKKDIDKLNKEYVFGASKEVCDQQGWMYTEQEDKLLIDIPGGKQVVLYADGSHEAVGFEGEGCLEVGDLLTKAIGEETEKHLLPEYYAERAHVRAIDDTNI